MAMAKVEADITLVCIVVGIIIMFIPFLSESRTSFEGLLRLKIEALSCVNGHVYALRKRDAFNLDVHSA